LAALASDAERLKALVELAQEDIAVVLGLPGPSSVPADVPLKELGLDSLMAVALCNRLSVQVGTKLPTTLAFDYPTPRAMAQLLLEKLRIENGEPSRPIWGEEQIRSKLRVVSIQALRASGLLERIMMQPNTVSSSDIGVDGDSERITTADIESLLEIADELI
jgi:acyl carrier protein